MACGGGAEQLSEAAAAGHRTGDYLLAHRIPKPVQRLLRRLPGALAARMLSQAIAKHAWTFAGSGTFSCGWQPQLVYAILGNPITAGLRAQAPDMRRLRGHL